MLVCHVFGPSGGSRTLLSSRPAAVRLTLYLRAACTARNSRGEGGQERFGLGTTAWYIRINGAENGQTRQLRVLQGSDMAQRLTLR